MGWFVRPGLDRRGAVSLMVAISGLALLGFVGLATEAGSWYLISARAQAAADAAAAAAVLEYAAGGTSAEITSAADYVASQNGFGSGVAVGCYADCSSPTSAQYQVTISTTVTPYLSSLFVGGAPTINVSSVAGLSSICPSGVACGCMVSLSGDLTVAQSQYAPGCVYASNASDATAISIGSTTTLTAYGLTTSGDCSTSGCANSGVTLNRNYGSFQPTTPNPYSAVDSAAATWTLPGCGTITPTSGGKATARSPAGGGTTVTVSGSLPTNELLIDTTNPGNIPGGTYATNYSGGTLTFSNPVTVATNDVIEAVSAVALTPGLYSVAGSCPADTSYVSTATSPPTFIMTGSQTTWTLAAGTYFFSGISLAIVSGTIECLHGGTACVPPSNGLTILLTNSGATTGNLYICNNPSGACTGATSANFSNAGFQSINAQTSVGVSSDLDGMLFYRQQATTGSNGSPTSPAVWIWGYYTDAHSNTVMNGSMYFPGAYATFSNPGNSATCAVVVAGFLTLTGRAGVTTNTTPVFCGNYGVTLAQPVAARTLD